jgi:hypothetical protein
MRSRIGFVLWLWTPTILLGAMDWRRLAPGAAVSAFLAALLSLSSTRYFGDRLGRSPAAGDAASLTPPRPSVSPNARRTR